MISLWPSRPEWICHSVALTWVKGAPPATVHLNLGRAERAAGRMDAAIAHLEEAIRLAPDDPDAEYSLGAALVAAGRPGEAISHLERALRLRPDDAEA